MAKMYKSIDNIERTKTIHQIYKHGYDLPLWVSTLKVHGANYGYKITKDEDGNITVKRFKRSGYLNDGEKFYGDDTFDYSERCRRMFDHLCGIYDLDVLTLHGEIFGGSYNHPDVEKVKGCIRVQKGVDYTPFNDFVVFDIKINGKFINWEYVKELCNEFGFKHVPELAKGTFKDLIEIDTVFDDPIHSLYGYPKIEGNKAEGWVIKPVEPLFFGNGERVILKGKNPKFKEKMKPKKPKEEFKYSVEGAKVYSEMVSYITENRLRNVLSHGHFESITNKDFGKLLGFFNKDIHDDFMKDFKEDFEGLDKKEKKHIMKNINKKCANLIRKIFLDIIDCVW